MTSTNTPPRANGWTAARRSVRHTTGALRLAVAVALLIGLAATATAQSPRVPDGYSSEVVHVKLEEGSNPSAIQRAIPPSVRRATVRVRPLFTVAPERLARLRAAGERRSGRAVRDLRLWFEIRLSPGADAARVIEALRAAPGVETVEPAPLPAPPPSAVFPLTAREAPPSAAVTPSFVDDQGYLDAGTDGIDAEFAWTVPGGNGAGVTVYDVEYSWNQTHEDLSKAAGVALLLDAGDSAVDPFSSNDHGTAVLGEVIADNDAKGVTGISWGAWIGLAPANTNDLGYNPANAIALAVADGDPGDVILIEQQTTVCGLASGMFGPSEWAQSVFDATQNATAAGFVVVAAAGNGNVDLDQAGCDGKFDRDVRDSGAIIVGAGRPPGADDREREGFSSYGSRVDLQGWGSSVMTTGYGTSYVDPDDPSNPDRWYRATFNGTSSASPIVTGAIANLQGIRIAHSLPLFTAAEVRDLLVDTGSPQLGDTDEHIGPRPNLLAAIATFVNVAPTADAGPDQTVECAAPGGTEVALDGTGSSDPNGDALTYTWRKGVEVIATGATPPVTLEKGSHTIELTVDDGNGGVATDVVLITVEDTTPPVVTLNGAADVTLECAVDTFVDPGATAVDACDGALDVAVTGSVDVATPGTYELTYKATDHAGLSHEVTRTVQVLDTTPPAFTIGVERTSLWPPDHKYHAVDLDALDLEASDLCDTGLSAADAVVSLATSDELEEATVPGDGETYDDILVAADCRSVEVRAERMQRGNGRVYSLLLEVADASDNVAGATHEVHVPANVARSPWGVLDAPALYTVAGCDVGPAALAGTAALGAVTDGVAAEGVAAGLSAAGTLPTEYALEPNVPNPFSSETAIQFALPEATDVRLVVYDVTGREVAVLADGPLPAGRHEVTWRPGALPAGVFLTRLEAGPFVATGRVLLVR